MDDGETTPPFFFLGPYKTVFVIIGKVLLKLKCFYHFRFVIQLCSVLHVSELSKPRIKLCVKWKI